MIVRPVGDITIETLIMYWEKARCLDVHALTILGDCCAEAWRITGGYVEAAKWYRQAAEIGYADAQYKLGNCYLNGLIADNIFEKAVDLHWQAAEQGHVDAQRSLGYCYDEWQENKDKLYKFSSVKKYKKIAIENYAKKYHDEIRLIKKYKKKEIDRRSFAPNNNEMSQAPETPANEKLLQIHIDTIITENKQLRALLTLDPHKHYAYDWNTYRKANNLKPKERFGKKFVENEPVFCNNDVWFSWWEAKRAIPERFNSNTMRHIDRPLYDRIETYELVENETVASYLDNL